MVDLFYSGAAHSSSYPPTHYDAVFPSSGDHHTVIVGRNWQLLPTALASRSPRFVEYDGSFKNHTSLRLLQQMEHENGIEPSTSSMARTRSNQLSYSRIEIGGSHLRTLTLTFAWETALPTCFLDGSPVPELSND